MKLYLIRHGESESNASGYYLGKDSELSTAGRMQARKLARRFAKIRIDLVVASDYRRSISTAGVIGKLKKKKVIIIPFLGEERYPKEFEQKHTDDPEVIRMRRILRKNRNKKGWHYSDEENFFDLKLRIQKFLKVLGRRKEKNILAVGHGISNRMIVGLMLFGKKLTPDLFQGLRRRLLTRNTGITMCEFENGQWRIHTWNDHAHLG